MFDSIRQRLLLGLFIVLILAIPLGAYFFAQNQTYKPKPQETKTSNKTAEDSLTDRTETITQPKATGSSIKEQLEEALKELPEGSSAPKSQAGSETTVATSFGPSLSLKARIEGRKENNQVISLFVGILEGNLGVNPKFLLSFNVNLPADGAYSGLSLAGLSAGATYTALLKGSAQIATSSAFIMSPTETKLNADKPLNMLSGDLNDDNVINSADYSIALSAFGQAKESDFWNGLADINLDGVVNVIDLSIIAKNLGQVGASGAWASTPPQSTQSAGLKASPSSSNQGSPSGSPANSGESGYWIWIPGNP